jgi:transcriptional regulator with XRE-family HTH domain
MSTVAKSTTNLHITKAVSGRLRWLRESKGLTLQEVAARTGYDLGYISKLERGKARNPSERFIASMVAAFRVNPAWLRTGEGDPYWDATKDSRTRIALPNWSEKRLQRIVAVLDELPDALAIDAVLGRLLHDETLESLQSIWREIGNLPNLPVTARLFWNDAFMRAQMDKLPGRPSKTDLTKAETSTKDVDVKAQLPSLLERLNRATKVSGKMSALADFLGHQTNRKIPLASVSRWLSGKREPGGEITLLMERWVEKQERQK